MWAGAPSASGAASCDVPTRQEREEAPNGDRRWVRRAQTADHVQPCGDRDRRGSPRQDQSGDASTGCIQRIHAQLFHQGAPPQPGLLNSDGRVRLKAAELSPAGAEAVDVALHMIDAITAASEPLRERIAALGRYQPGCRA